MSDLVKRAKDWRIGVLGGVDSKGFEIAGELIARIEELERELRNERNIRREEGFKQVKELEQQLAAEKALADQLYEAARNYRVSAFNARDKSFMDAHAAYRKTRGL